MVATYRKKPVKVDAMQYLGGELSLKEAVEFIGEAATVDHGRLYIKTLEGYMRADIGDMIIRGIKGEFYPCKPDIFKQTYERVP